MVVQVGGGMSVRVCVGGLGACVRLGNWIFEEGKKINIKMILNENSFLMKNTFDWSVQWPVL